MNLIKSKYLRSVLKKNNIDFDYDGYNNYCKCQKCKHVWLPLIQKGGKFKKGFWKCPNGCTIK